MEHIEAIQNVINENQQEMPTGVVTNVMEHLQKLYNTGGPKLYRVHFTFVEAVPYKDEGQEDAKLMHHSYRIIAESVKFDRDDHRDGIQLLKAGLIREADGKVKKCPIIYGGAHNIDTGDTICGNTEMAIIHSIEPLVSEPTKRARDA